MRLVMMGTGAFALPTFSSLYDSSHEVVGLVTQPDKTGRGHHKHTNPLKELALKSNTPVLQPNRSNDKDAIEELRALKPDLTVVAAYGQILSAEVIEVPTHGTVNLHASLLPKYRGAAPIQYAIWNGETETGVSVFQLVPKLDAGPVLAMQSTPIGDDETSEDVHDRLAILGASVVSEVIDKIEAGNLAPIPQDDSIVSKAPQIRKHQGQIDWTKSAEEIRWHIRAMQPWPKPFTFLPIEGKPDERITITKVSVVKGVPSTNKNPGSIIEIEPGQIFVQTGSGILEITELQPAGKRAMAAAEFLNGRKLESGTQFAPTSS